LIEIDSKRPSTYNKSTPSYRWPKGAQYLKQTPSNRNEKYGTALKIATKKVSVVDAFMK